HEHRASAADAMLAADVRAGQAEFFAQEIDERRARLNGRLARAAIHDEAHGARVAHAALDAGESAARPSTARRRSVGAARSAYLPPLRAATAKAIFSGLIGSSVRRAPTASWTALAMAAGAGTMGGS